MKVYNNYPKSEYAPKSLYTLGWMFEKNLFQYDSAYFYYDILLGKYPNSEYAKDINLSVIYKLVIDSGQEIPDSLKTKQVVILPPSMPDKGRDFPKIQLPQKKNSEFDPKSMIQEPANMFQKAKELLLNPGEALKTIELPTNPLENPAEFFKLDETKQSDSTKVEIPEENKEKKK